MKKLLSTIGLSICFVIGGLNLVFSNDLKNEATPNEFTIYESNLDEWETLAEEGNNAHVGAPMPGVIAGVTVSKGQSVNEGDLLLTIEAMKMETGLHAERDAVIKVVHVSTGSQIEAKDLLIEFE